MSRSSSSTIDRYLSVSAEVSDALSAGEPVVALESTLISHGMPYPDNLATARRLEAVAREAGAVPATVAIIAGKLRVGLSDSELEALASPATRVQKASRRDIPLLIHQGGYGSTTVAGTMAIAALAGLRFFATGGIGGVHRRVEQTMDVSADLPELARTSVAVFCSGAKSVLDLGKTLEYLETHGVAVLGYRTATLPAFYCRDSGLALEYSFETAAELARVLHTKWTLGMAGGVVIANPVPEAAAMPEERIEAFISQATDEAAALGIRGKECTPFLLRRIAELSGGESLEANVALVLDNARLAAETAGAYRKLTNATEA